jgi:predicted RNA-binding protein (virulence factor B family)
MLQIGRYNTLVVQREVDFGVYLNPKEAEEVLLPAKYVPPKTRPGDSLRVFVYTDSEDRPVATTLRPKAVVGEVACLQVKDTGAVGAFLDWGLEKDLLVPNSEQQVRLRVGQHCVVKVLLDAKTRRVYASTRIPRHCRKAGGELKVGQQVRVMIYRFAKIGTLVVVDDAYLGMVYRSETYERLRIGDRRPGYIRSIRKDGRLDIALKKPGAASLSASGRRIMEALQKEGGFIPCHDRSRPAEITRRFTMSKKEFKRAIGGLYKQRLITISDQGIRLASKKPAVDAPQNADPPAKKRPAKK